MWASRVVIFHIQIKQQRNLAVLVNWIQTSALNANDPQTTT